MCGSPYESVCIGPPPSKTAIFNVPALLAACENHRADAVHPWLRLSLGKRPLCRDPSPDHNFIYRAKSRTHPPDGRQDRGQEDREETRIPVVPAPTVASA